MRPVDRTVQIGHDPQPIGPAKNDKGEHGKPEVIPRPQRRKGRSRPRDDQGL